MAIRLLQSVFLAGVIAEVNGAILSLSPALESDLVAQGKAAWAYRLDDDPRLVEHAADHSDMVSRNNRLLNSIPTQLLVPYDTDDVANFTSSLWPSCTLAQDIDRVCPATGLPSVKLTVVGGEVRNNEIRFFNHTPFTLGDNDVYIALIYMPQSTSSGWVYLRFRSGTVGNESDYRTIGQNASYMHQGWNVVVLKNTEVVVGASEYGNTAGTSSSSYHEWITTGTMPPGSTVRSTTLLIGGVGGTDWNFGGLFKAPAGWAKAAIMFSYDDMLVSAYDLAFPLLETFGWKGNANIAPKVMNEPSPSYVNMTHIRDLMRRGHEIWGHSLTHPDLTLVSVGEQARQFEQARLFWNANGIPAAGKLFAWPQNKYNDETIASAKAAGCVAARAAAGVIHQSWLPGLSIMALPSLNAEVSNSWHVDAAINGACLRGQALIIYMHNPIPGGAGIDTYPGTTQHYYDHLVRWCQLIASHEAAGRAEVFTMSSYFAACGIDLLRDRIDG